MTIMWAWIVWGWENIKTRFRQWVLFIQWVIGTAVAILEDFGINVWVLVRNVWKLWDILPWLIWLAVNKALWKLEEFLNRWWKIINDFLKKAWFEWDLIWKVSVWKLDVWNTSVALESFKKTNRKIQEAKNQAIATEIAREKRKNKEFDKLWKEALNIAFKDLQDKQNKSKAILNKDFKNVGWWSILWDTKKPKWTGGGWKTEAEKRAEKRKKEAEKLAKEQEELEAFQLKKRQERVKARKDLYDKRWETFQKQVELSKKQVEEFDKWIEKLKKDLKELDDDLKELEEGRGVTLWERYIEIRERELEIKKELKDIREDEMTIESYEEEKKLNQELNNLLLERQLIKSKLYPLIFLIYFVNNFM
jgi:hypothetical protein